MGTKRDNFTAATKTDLAFRAGHVCSYPSCGRGTSSPTSNGATRNSGRACHIIPASGDGPRAKLTIHATAAEIKDYSNGVWMCVDHANLIDSDDGRFLREVLVAYRQRAEHLAQVSAETTARNPQFVAQKLILEAPELEPISDGRYTLSDETRRCVDYFIEDTGTKDYLGADLTQFVFVFFAEMLLNAFEHGNASSGLLLATAHTISLQLDDVFTLEDLRASRRPGGAHEMLLHLTEQGAGTISISEKGTSNGVEFLITGPGIRDIRSMEPCAVAAVPGGRITTDQLAALQGCKTIHVCLPERLIMSDRGYLYPVTAQAVFAGALLVVHGREDQFPPAKRMLSKVEGLDQSLVRYAR